MTKEQEFNKKFNKLCRTKVVFESIITIGEILNSIDSLPLEDTVLVIKNLDLQCEDWKTTEELLNHFLTQFITVLEDVEIEDREEYISNDTKQQIEKLLTLLK